MVDPELHVFRFGDDGRMYVHGQEVVLADERDNLRAMLDGARAERDLAEADAAQLRQVIQGVLDLRSSYEADRGRDVPLVVNLQAREMLTRALPAPAFSRNEAP